MCTSGSVLWATSAGGTDYDVANAVVTDHAGNVYLAGNFADSAITFGTTTLTDGGASDIFFVKYDDMGNVLWAKREGGIGGDQPYGLATDGIGSVYLAGQFSSPTITFDTATLTNAGSYDMFVTKYFFPIPDSIPAVGYTPHNLRVYPNPTNGALTLLKDNETEILALTVVDMVGKVVGNISNIDPQNRVHTSLSIGPLPLPTGMYVLKVLSSSGESSITFSVKGF